MIIELIIILILALIFYIYIRKWPEVENPSKDENLNQKTESTDIVKNIIEQPVSENEEVRDLINQANGLFNQEEWNKAEKLYLKAASIDPQCVKAYSRLGMIYLKTGKDWHDAEEALRQAAKLDPKNGFILNNLGLVLYNQDKFDEAIDCFNKSIKADDSQASRYANLGIALFAKRQFSKAERSLKKAVNLDPENHEYHDLLKESTEKKKSHQTLIRR